MVPFVIEKSMLSVACANRMPPPCAVSLKVPRLSTVAVVWLAKDRVLSTVLPVRVVVPAVLKRTLSEPVSGPLKPTAVAVGKPT